MPFQKDNGSYYELNGCSVIVNVYDIHTSNRGKTE